MKFPGALPVCWVISPLKNKILIESNPERCRMVVRKTVFRAIRVDSICGAPAFLNVQPHGKWYLRLLCLNDQKHKSPTLALEPKWSCGHSTQGLRYCRVKALPNQPYMTPNNTQNTDCICLSCRSCLLSLLLITLSIIISSSNNHMTCHLPVQYRESRAASRNCRHEARVEMARRAMLYHIIV